MKFVLPECFRFIGRESPQEHKNKRWNKIVLWAVILFMVMMSFYNKVNRDCLRLLFLLEWTLYWREKTKK